MRTEKKIQDRTYQPGDRAVYPGHGVGTIDKIEQRTICGEATSILILRLENGLVIMCPASALRPVISRKDVSEVYRILREKSTPPKGKWEKTYRMFVDTLQHGSVYALAALVRDIHRVRDTRDLSFGERKIQSKALELIVGELVTATGASADTIERKILENLN